MKHLLALFFALMTLPVMAAPRIDDKTAGPAILGQTKTWNELLVLVKDGIKTIGGDKLYAEFEKNGLAEISPEIFPSINPNQPFLLYGTADAELAKCRLVLMVPVKATDEFLMGVKQFGIPIEKSKEANIYDVGQADQLPFPVNLRFHEGYAYFSFGGADALDLKTILAPKTILNEKEKSLASISFYFERMPAALKKGLVANLVDLIQQGNGAIDDPELKEIFKISSDLTIRWIRQLADQGRELSFKLNGDPKSGDIKFDIIMDAIPKTPLAEAIARRQPNTNAFAGMAKMPNALQWLIMSPPLFHEDIQDSLIKLVTVGEKAALTQIGQNGSPEAVTLAEKGFKSLKATLKTGSMDLGMVILGPNKDDQFGMVFALQLEETAEIEKAVKTLVKTSPEEVQKMVKFDAGKIGDMIVHEIIIPEVPEQLKKYIGNDTNVYIAVGKNVLYAGIGVDAKQAIKGISEMKPGKVAAFENLGNPKAMAKVIKKLFSENGQLPGDDSNIMEGMLTNMERHSAPVGMKLDITGGEKLTISFTYGTQFLSFGGPSAFFLMAGRVGPNAAPPVKAKPIAPPAPDKKKEEKN